MVCARKIEVNHCEAPKGEEANFAGFLKEVVLRMSFRKECTDND